MVNTEATDGQTGHHDRASTLAPSEGAPQLTINHEVAADLDSSNAFEGPEKLLEVWFAPNVACLPSSARENGLKAVSAQTWEEMLDLVNCKVLSIVESENVDAYLLSESSMFVFPHKIILKTCGTTTLLLGLHCLLRIAAEHAGFPFHNAQSLEDAQAAATPYRVFYSRKNFLFPDKQRGPHRSWRQEVDFLDDMFANGSAYMVGPMNRDHWCLYMTSPNAPLTPPRTPERDENGELVSTSTAGATTAPTRTAAKIPTGLLSPFARSVQEEDHDETLEVLMTDLDVERAKQFYLDKAAAMARKQDPASKTQENVTDKAHFEQGLNEGLTTEGHALGTVVSDSCGLSDVYPTSVFPDARIDAYLFSPCGFSANGVIPVASAAAQYFTVHVTPESSCSYASFETNIPSGQRGKATGEVIAHVVSIFCPGRFSVTLFETKGKKGIGEGENIREQYGGWKQRGETISGYRRHDRIVYDFGDYDLIFRYYERDGWVSDGMARVGEETGPGQSRERHAHQEREDDEG